ncbi:MAG TPA: hypothetical protein VMB80_13090 [Candidatus Acidoferrum sp.]|nr:hypothetical protein [Candidatus Acidoferrum sp.]
MNANRLKKLCVAFVLASTLNGPLSTAFAQGTAFTYQGQLQNNGSPASGSYNLAFSLFNTNNGGVAIAGPVTNNAVNVTNGLFTSLVDFGFGVFTGASNWLQIAVETNGGSSFTNLSPRQQLTPVPYAIYAEGTSNLLSTLPAAQLPGNVITNGQLNVTLCGMFCGDGTALMTRNNTAWLYYYDQGNQLSGAANVWVNAMFNIPGPADPTSMGWTYNPPTGTFTCSSGGTYLVEYNALVQVGAGGGNASLRAQLNGLNAVPGSGVNLDTAALGAGNYEPVSKSFLAQFNTGDTLNIQFASTVGGAITLLHGGGGVPGSSQASVSVTITRIQ